jgi:hypothetical protein
MAFYQPISFHAKQSPTTRVKDTNETVRYDRTYLLDALNQGKLSLNLSPLLGCDYIFIGHKPGEKLLDAEHVQRTLNDILRLLPVVPKQTIFIAVYETPELERHFTRFDFVWLNQNAESITKVDINRSEQIDFMEMIYNCSSPV